MQLNERFEQLCTTATAGPHLDTRENWSEAVKRLKPRLLQRLADTLQMESCLVFVRTNFDADNLEKFLNDLGKVYSMVFLLLRASQNDAHCVRAHQVQRRQSGEVRQTWVHTPHEVRSWP